MVLKKRALCAVLLLACLSLCACGKLLPSSYAHLQPHNQTDSAPVSTDALTASTYSELRKAVFDLVQNGVEHGKIHIYSYDGDVNADSARAILEVSREEPIGAYAVDYITHNCSLIVSYYEISVDITFRRTVQQMANVIPFPSSYNADAKDRLRRAVTNGETSLVMYFTYYLDTDFEQQVRSYYDDSPGTVIAMPKVSVSRYPESGSSQIVEITMQYPQTELSLTQMRKAIEENVAAAAVYSRYSSSDFGEAELLFKYLTERFTYSERSTETPVYSLFCEGVADSEGAAKSFRLLCDAAELPCCTVKGLYDGEEYWWNIAELDGRNVHVDPLRSLLEGRLTVLDDSQMIDYYWNSSKYPACPPPAAQEPVVQTEQDSAEQITPPAE